MEGFCTQETIAKKKDIDIRKNIKRKKTKDRNIYFNETTKKYDVKYNYKVYNPLTQKNDYKSKWIYNLSSLAEAKIELAKLQTGGNKAEDKDITLQGIYEVWKINATAQNYSPTTLRNTEQQFKMLTQFISADTKIKDITEDTYMLCVSKCREHGYSDETLHSVNATFRKLINLAYKKRFVTENILHRAEPIKTKKKDTYRLITNDEWEKLDGYFLKTKFYRLGYDRYKRFRFMFNLLYYTGMRIGECLALTWGDFEEYNYYPESEQETAPFRFAGTKATEHEHLRGMRVHVTKSYLSDLKITKDPKNVKTRKIPLPPCVERLYYKNRPIEYDKDARIFDYSYGNCLTLITKACKEVGIQHCSCHDFRHTYISNLMRLCVPLPVIEKVSGDTQETILKRYSHMWEDDERLVLIAIEKI